VRVPSAAPYQKPSHRKMRGLFHFRATPIVGAPAPGANGVGPGAALRFDSAFAPGAVLLHRNQDTPPTVGAPAPGANGRARCCGFTPLSHRGRCSYTGTGIPLQP